MNKSVNDGVTLTTKEILEIEIGVVEQRNNECYLT